HPRSVPGGGGRPGDHRRSVRDRPRHRYPEVRRALRRLAGLGSGRGHLARLRLLGVGRDHLRLLPGAESKSSRSDRSSPLRVERGPFRPSSLRLPQDVSSETTSPAVSSVATGARWKSLFSQFLDPRRSLSARLLWTVLPVAVIPAAIYWITADRLLTKAGRELPSILCDAAVDAEQSDLRYGADARIREVAQQTRKIVEILTDAARDASAALQAGPDRDLPAEPLVHEP